VDQARQTLAAPRCFVSHHKEHRLGSRGRACAVDTICAKRCLRLPRDEREATEVEKRFSTICSVGVPTPVRANALLRVEWIGYRPGLRVGRTLAQHLLLLWGGTWVPLLKGQTTGWGARAEELTDRPWEGWIPPDSSRPAGRTASETPGRRPAVLACDSRQKAPGGMRWKIVSNCGRAMPDS
jgi:hypothetical protein